MAQTATQTFRIGVLGLGEGRSAIAAALASSAWSVGAICDVDAELCRRRCDEFDLPIE